MRGIVSVLLSVARLEYRSLGKGYTTIKSLSLHSAASLTLIELTDWLSAVRGICQIPNTREAQAFENSEAAGASRASPLCNPDSLSASWTALPVLCLVPQPYTQQAAWLMMRHFPMPVGVEASIAV